MVIHHQHHRLQGEKKHQKAAEPPIDLGIRQFVYGRIKTKEFSQNLWIEGELQESDSKAVAIIGSRACSDRGAQDAYELSTELVHSGVCIVSGLALGIDSFAHRAALKAGGRTLAILGTGLDRIRPLNNRSLYSEVISSGAGISPFPPGFTGYHDGRNFLERNAVIASFSRVLVVVEAKVRSGSLSAARSALRQGRPVGLMASLVRSQAWAEDFSQEPGVFVVNSAADVLERLGS